MLRNDKQSSSQTNTGTTYQDTGDKYKEVKKQEEQKNTQSAGQSSYNAQKKKSGIKRRSPMKGSSSKQGNKIIKWMGYADNVNSVKEKEGSSTMPSLNRPSWSRVESQSCTFCSNRFWRMSQPSFSLSYPYLLTSILAHVPCSALIDHFDSFRTRPAQFTRFYSHSILFMRGWKQH